MSASIPVAFAQNVLADKYDDQVKKLQSEADSYQQRASTLGVLASTLQAQLDTLTKQKNEIQAQINTSQAKRNKLEKDIAATEKKIAINKEALGEIVADMYVDIEPEVLTNFISKDSNNRLEIHISKKTGKEDRK